MKRALTQQEIDEAFGKKTEAQRVPSETEEFDVRKLDKIPKSQLQSLHFVHENFTRNLASSLSAYLRSYVMLSLISLEQISYGDFLEQISYGDFREGSSSPACLAYISLHPYDGSAVLDINTALAFRFIELLLGSRTHSQMPMHRQITDIEKKLLQTVLRIFLHDLRDSWKSVADIEFSIQSMSSEPALQYVLAPSEAMIVIAIDVRIGSTAGVMNLAIPSRFVKRLRNKFDQLQKIRKAEATEQDQLRVGRLLQNVKLNFEVQIQGGDLPAKTLLTMKPGDVLVLDHPQQSCLTGLLNGNGKWLGNIRDLNGQLAFEVVKDIRP